MFLLGSLVLAGASIVTFSSTNIFLFLLSFFIFGFGSGVTYSNCIFFILNLWGKKKGYAAGVFESIIGLGYFVGPLVGGAISEFSPNLPYLYGSGLSLVVFFLHLILKNKEYSKRQI
jgi:MFS family permease